MYEPQTTIQAASDEQTRIRASYLASPPVKDAQALSTITTTEIPHEASSIIAHSPTASTRPSTAISSASSPTSIQSRKAVCTHIHLQRIYGPYKCHHCMRVPRLGWVYRCIQDLGNDFVGFNHCGDDNFTAALQRRLQQESDARIQQPETLPSSQSQLPAQEAAGPSSSLKPWVQKLADADFYTPEQLHLLKTQRQNVLRRISESRFPCPLAKAELQDVTISDSTTLLKQGNYMRPAQQPLLYGSSSLRSCTLSPYWQVPPPVTEGSPDAVSLDSPQDQPMQPQQSVRKVNQTPPGGMCTYQTCSTCRPASRDRSWQCLDPIHYSAGDRIQLPDPSIDNRLVSHPDLIYSACHKVFHPEQPLEDSGIRTSEDDFYDDDYISGYESSEISPDISSVASLEGTPTSSQFDESRGWDMPNHALPRWVRPPVLRRSSSMDPRLLRSSRDIENMDLTSGLPGLPGLPGLGIAAAGNAGAEAGVTADEATQGGGATDDAGDTNRHVDLGEWFVRPGAAAALGHHRTDEAGSPEAYAAAVGLSRKRSEEVIVPGGVAVTEQAVAAGDADVAMQV